MIVRVIAWGAYYHVGKSPNGAKAGFCRPGDILACKSTQKNRGLGAHKKKSQLRPICYLINQTLRKICSVTRDNA
jgi:hypothetical protein